MCCRTVLMCCRTGVPVARCSCLKEHIIGCALCALVFAHLWHQNLQASTIGFKCAHPVFQSALRCLFDAAIGARVAPLIIIATWPAARPIAWVGPTRAGLHQTPAGRCKRFVKLRIALKTLLWCRMISPVIGSAFSCRVILRARYPSPAQLGRQTVNMDQQNFTTGSNIRGLLFYIQIAAAPFAKANTLCDGSIRNACYVR